MSELFTKWGDVIFLCSLVASIVLLALGFMRLRIDVNRLYRFVVGAIREYEKQCGVKDTGDENGNIQ